MDKNRVINTILNLVLVIVIVIVLLKSNSTKEETEDLNFKIAQLEGGYNKLNNDIFTNTKDIAEIWFNTRSNYAKNEFEKFENDFFCQSGGTEDVSILRSYYSIPKNWTHADVFVMTYEGWDKVYYSDGRVLCYRTPIDEMNPTPSDCVELCKNE